MFPICPTCKCETLTPDCGAWTPDFKHDCIESLKQDEMLVQRQLGEIQARRIVLESEQATVWRCSYNPSSDAWDVFQGPVRAFHIDCSNFTDSMKAKRIAERIVRNMNSLGGTA